MNKQDGKDTVNKIMSHVEKMKQIAWNQKGHLGASSLALGTSLVGTIEGTAICTGISCSAEIVGNGAIGNAFAAGLECAYIFYRYHGGKISGREAAVLSGTAIASTCASTATFMSVSKITDKLIAAGQISPQFAIGLCFLAAIGVAVICRKTIGDLWQYHMGNDEEQLEREKLRKAALKFFFDDENLDVDNEKKFNEKILRRRYRRLAMIYHPDAKDGEEKEWLKLCAYYGILTRICDYKIEEKSKNGNDEKSDIKSINQ